MRSERDKEQQRINEAPVTLAAFLKGYNKNISTNFPRASVAMLKKFQETHPALFNGKDGWSIDKHRKKLIDWLSSNPDVS